ncbi:MAG TPA: hypothetical protein VLB09_03190, partial [Nitrospiria bacterium]|nr:hypothetical protein [Nitrospiria bacterium]
LDGEWKTTNAFGPGQRISFEAREPFGMFFGADADIFGGIVAGIEFNLIHETSVTIRLAHTLGGGGTGNH